MALPPTAVDGFHFQDGSSLGPRWVLLLDRLLDYLHHVAYPWQTSLAVLLFFLRRFRILRAIAALVVQRRMT